LAIVSVIDATAAVVRVDDRNPLFGEYHRRGAPVEREHDVGIAARVRAAEVEELDPFVAAAERQAIGERPLREPPATVVLEDVLLGAGLQAVHRVHLLHQLRGVRVRDHFHSGWKLHVAADVIEVRVRVDDRRHRLVGELLHRFDDRLA
jgi:hypothetical protein